MVDHPQESSVLFRFADQFIPEGQESLNLMQRLRLRMFVLFTFGINSLTFIFVPALWKFEGGPGFLVWATLLISVLFISIPFLLKHGVPFHFLSTAFVATLISIFTIATLQHGGFSIHNLVWYLLLPPLTTFLFGKRVGLATTIAVSCLIVGFFLAKYHGLPRTQPPNISSWPSIVMLILLSLSTVLSLISYAYETIWQRSYELLRSSIQEGNQANEELAIERDRAQEANRAKSIFLANMSHELRTPLNAIIGYSELLIEELDETSEDAQEDLQKIQKAGKQLLSLINDILDLSRVEAGKQRLFLSNFAIQPLIDELEATVSILARENKNVLEIYNVGKVHFLRTDRNKLKQILINLLSNACKFTKSGKIMFIIDQKFEGTQRKIKFRVMDNGPGIPPEKQKRLFEAFYQVDGSAQRQHGGSGLGLAISLQLTRLLGGSLEVQSSPNKGSNFTLRLKQPLEDNINREDPDEDDFSVVLPDFFPPPSSPTETSST
ncbi:MAG: hypothetical protein H6727_00100 [Myxococcales bacterium]|nr:hypothetical protein [Myxococcales bacterium]